MYILYCSVVFISLINICVIYILYANFQGNQSRIHLASSDIKNKESLKTHWPKLLEWDVISYYVKPQLSPRVFVSVHALTWSETSNPLWHRWCSLHSTVNLVPCLSAACQGSHRHIPCYNKQIRFLYFYPLALKGIAASKRLNAYMEVNINHIKCLGPGHSLTACFSVTRNNLCRGHTTWCSVTERAAVECWQNNDHFLLVARGAQIWLSTTEYWPLLAF